MKLTYQTYVAQMRGFRQTPMSEKDFNAMQGIEEYVMPPLFIEPKAARSKKVEPILNAHVKIQKAK